MLMFGVRVQNALPDILAVVQVALEGAISSASAQAALARGNLPQVSTAVEAVAAAVRCSNCQHLVVLHPVGLQAYCC
jgi:GNAT acetyltransferase 2